MRSSDETVHINTRRKITSPIILGNIPSIIFFSAFCDNESIFINRQEKDHSQDFSYFFRKKDFLQVLR